MNVLNWPAGAAATLLLAGAGVGLLALTRDHRDTRGFQRGLFLAAFGIRLVMAIVIYAGGLLTVLKDEDSKGWYTGVRIMNDWTSKGVGPDVPERLLHAFTGTANEGYHYTLAAFFWLTGLVGRLPAAALSAWFGGIATVLTYRLTRRVATERAARLTSALVAVMPLMVIWSAQTLKEPLVLVIEAAGLYACLRIHQGSFAARHVLLGLAAFLLIVPVRFYVAAVLGASLVGAIVWSGWRGPRRGAALWAGRAAVTVAVVAVLATLIVNIQGRQRFDLQYIQTFRAGVSPGGTSLAPESEAPAPAARPPLESSPAAYPSAPPPTAAPTPPESAMFDIRKPPQVPLVLITGAAYALLAPFPWQFGSSTSLRFLLTAPDMVAWWILFFVVVVPGIWMALRWRVVEVLPLVIFLVLLGGLYSAMFGNVGIAYRQRAQLFPVLLALAAAGHAPRSAARHGRSALRSIGLVLASVLPGPLKRAALRHGYGFRIDRRARIGLAYLDCEALTIGPAARIRHGVAFVRCGSVAIGEQAIVGSLNLFRGGRQIELGAFATVLRLNVFNAIPDHDCTTNPDSSLSIGEAAVVTAEHRVDFTDRVAIGRGSILAGRGSSLWTHNRRDSAPIRIGDHCYVGSEVRMAPGAVIPDCSIVGLGSVVVDDLHETYSLFAGVPARRRRALEPSDYQTIFGKTRQDLPDDWCQPPPAPKGDLPDGHS